MSTDEPKLRGEDVFAEFIESEIDGALSGRIKEENLGRYANAAQRLCAAFGPIGQQCEIGPEETVVVLSLFCQMMLARTHTACAVIGTPMKTPLATLVACLVMNIENTRSFGEQHAREIAKPMAEALSGGKAQ